MDKYYFFNIWGLYVRMKQPRTNRQAKENRGTKQEPPAISIWPLMLLFFGGLSRHDQCQQWVRLWRVLQEYPPVSFRYSSGYPLTIPESRGQLFSLHICALASVCAVQLRTFSHRPLHNITCYKILDENNCWSISKSTSIHPAFNGIAGTDVAR